MSTGPCDQIFHLGDTSPFPEDQLSWLNKTLTFSLWHSQCLHFDMVGILYPRDVFTDALKDLAGRIGWGGCAYGNHDLVARLLHERRAGLRIGCPDDVGGARLVHREPLRPRVGLAQRAQIGVHGRGFLPRWLQALCWWGGGHGGHGWWRRRELWRAARKGAFGQHDLKRFFKTDTGARPSAEHRMKKWRTIYFVWRLLVSPS